MIFNKNFLLRKQHKCSVFSRQLKLRLIGPRKLIVFLHQSHLVPIFFVIRTAQKSPPAAATEHGRNHLPVLRGRTLSRVARWLRIFLPDADNCVRIYAQWARASSAVRRTCPMKEEMAPYKCSNRTPEKNQRGTTERGKDGLRALRRTV